MSDSATLAQDARILAGNFTAILATDADLSDDYVIAKMRVAVDLLDRLAANIAPSVAEDEDAWMDDKPVTKPYAFKVGDRVRIARKVETDSQGRDCGWPGDEHLGAECTILSVDTTYEPEMSIHVNAEGGDYWYSDEALDLLPAEDAQ